MLLLDLMPLLLLLLGEMNLKMSYLLIQISSLLMIRLLVKLIQVAFQAIKLAVYNKYSYVLFESDSKGVIEALQNINSSPPWFLASFLSDVIVVLSSLLCLVYSFVSRDVNFLFHNLARQLPFCIWDCTISISFLPPRVFFFPKKLKDELSPFFCSLSIYLSLFINQKKSHNFYIEK